MRKLRSLWKIVFGRTALLVLLLLIQFVVTFGVFVVLGNRSQIFDNIILIVEIVVLIYLINTNQNSSFKLMWIILILVAPVMGVTFYIYTRIQPGTRRIARRMDELTIEEDEYMRPDSSAVARLSAEPGTEPGLFKYLYEKGNFPVYDDAAAKYFPLGEDKFREMIYQLEKARDFIFLEYFIIDKGEMWDTVLAILKKKAREGVEVRLMYDGTCTLSLLPINYPEKIERYGIKCKVFSPMKPFLTTHQNNRDHRKILVIDGHTAFTGGINLADEYINKRERFGHWKDTAVMVQGEAVKSFTLMFLQLWNIDEHKRENYGRYIVQDFHFDVGMRTGGYIAPYSDSPFDHENVGEKVYLDILNTARDYVHIMTPYLILDEELINALIYTAQRGVDVTLILPHIPDKKYAYFLARTYYAKLIGEGVKIYEYTPGFVHAKVFVSDDEKAVVGTINLDFRSLFLHFECAAYVWQNPVVDDIEDDFQSTLEKCERMTLIDCKGYSLIGKVCGRILRFIAPLM